MTHKRILVALNLTDGPEPAFERALALAKTSGAELYLLHAVPADYPHSFRAADRLRRATEFRQRAETAGVSVVTAEQAGDPAEIIVLHADARAVDLVVMGTERRTGWARFRQRSVAERVLRRTKRPTLVVASDDIGDTSGFENLLVAVDLFPAGAFGDRAEWLVPEYRGDVLGAARGRLKAVMPPTAGADVKLKGRVASGPVAETIGMHAADVSADLIVVGRSRRFMHLGSTAVRILRTTTRALLMVPPTATAHVVDTEPSVYRRAA